MPMQRYKPEQIVTVLRQIEVAGGHGGCVPGRPRLRCSARAAKAHRSVAPAGAGAR